MRRAILIDAGGVLIPDYWPAAAAEWADRLGTSPPAFMDALFDGSDQQVLVGRVGEAAWWQVVAARLQIGPGRLAELRADLAARESWSTNNTSPASAPARRSAARYRPASGLACPTSQDRTTWSATSSTPAADMRAQVRPGVADDDDAGPAAGAGQAGQERRIPGSPAPDAG